MVSCVKKVLALVLCVMICISFCSCTALSDTLKDISSLINPKGIAEDVSLGYTQIISTDFVYSQYYTPYQCKDSYNCLENDQMRRLYNMLYDNAFYVYPKSFSDGEYKCKQVILEEAQLTQAQIRLTIKALTDDNPHIFWLSTTFGYLVSQDDNYTAVQLYSRQSPESLSGCVKELKTKVNDFYASLENNLTPYQLEKKIHNYVLKKCEYDNSLKGVKTVPDDKAESFDVYGALVKSVAVCEGYSRAFQMLCNGVGIRCVLVIGESNDELHMWNAVHLGGDWYFVDTTWDDKEDKAFMYDYFNISEKQLLYDHDYAPLYTEMTDEEICGDGLVNALTSNFFIPECDSTAYNYYVRESAHLTDYSGESVIESMLTAAIKKKEYFHFYIDPKSLTYEYATDQLFYTYPQYFFNYIDVVNSSLSDYSIDTSNLSLYKKESLSVVTVVLKYV